MSEEFRVERDTMGEMRVPVDALFGAQTARALDNFPIGGLRFPRAFIRAGIMPGKTNPVIAESLLMVCAAVIGHHAAIASCRPPANFELNTIRQFRP